MTYDVYDYVYVYNYIYRQIYMYICIIYIYIYVYIHIILIVYIYNSNSIYYFNNIDIIYIIYIYIADTDEPTSSMNALFQMPISEGVTGVTSMGATASSGIPERACLVHLEGARKATRWRRSVGNDHDL